MQNKGRGVAEKYVLVCLVTMKFDHLLDQKMLDQKTSLIF